MKRKPNIVFILTDDQGAWAMGCAGNRDVKTPNLDRLAAEGVRFDEFYCASPVCSPARASLVTGKMPSCHGVQDWIERGNVDAYKFPHMSALDGFDMSDRAIDYLAGHRTYMEVLAESGYTCALSGKWHLGDNAAKKKGFDKWYTIGRGGCSYYHPDICDEGDMSIGQGYITDLITERSLRYIDELSGSEKPFYLSVHYTAPHSPWEAQEHPEEYRQLYADCEFTGTPDLPIHPNQIRTCPIGDTKEKRRENLTGYYAAISSMDAGVGKILDKLKEKELADDTIVIFTADNGMNMGHHGIWGKGNGTYPPNMYDSSVKVPLIIRIPDMGEGEKGMVCHNMASQYDIFPTILELAGCEWIPEPMQPGKSMVPMIREPGAAARESVVVYDEYGKTRMIKKGKYKLVYRYGGEPCEFYDMASDPDEEKNLYGDEAYASVISLMKEELESWFKQYTVEEMDARKFDVRGRGQDNLCGEKDAFNTQIEYYYKERGEQYK